jgi:membrane protease YdiL (CAAX protease family)
VNGPSFWQALWKNKLYVILGVVVAVLLTMAQFSPSVKEEKRVAKAESAKFQAKLKKAEVGLKEAIKEKGSLENYLKENPKGTLLVAYGTLFFLVVMLYGLWIDGWCFIRWFKRKPALETLPYEGEPPRWQISDVFRIIILFLGLSIGFAWIGNAAEHFLPHIFTPNGKIVLHGTLADLTAIGLILYFSRFKYKQDFFKIQINRKNIGSDILVGISSYLAFLPVVLGILLLLLWVMSLFHYEPPPQKIVEIFVQEGQNPIIFFYTLVLAAIIGPALEEIFFRGFFYAAFRKKYSAIPSALVTAIFFAGLHETAFAFLPVFALSLLLTYVYEKRKSLVAPIALHIFHNSLFMGYFFLMKQNFLDKFLH